MIPDVVSKNGIDVCFEEERKRLDDILCHDLELMSLLLRSFAIFSMYSCFAMRMDAVTELCFVLNCVQMCSLFDFFARLKSRFLRLICLLIFDPWWLVWSHCYFFKWNGLFCCFNDYA